MRGKIHRLIVDKRFGFIKGDDGQDYFFHQSCLQNAHYDDLVEGQPVEDFEATKGQKGLRAENVVVGLRTT